MNRTLRALFPLAIIACATPSLMADVTMRITGKVLAKDGKPVAGAKIVLKKVDTGWTRELTTDAEGVYSQAGLQPDKDKNFEVTITKDGFTPHVKRIAVPLVGSSMTIDFHLYRAGETPLEEDAADFSAAATTTAAPAVDPSLKEDADARAAFNAAIPLYNAKQYAEALPNLATAYKGITDAVATMKDEQAKADSQALIPTVARAYGMALHEVGKDDEAIEPLSRAVDSDPKNKENASSMQALVQIYTKKKDDANRAKYQGLLNEAMGVSGAATPYSEAAKAFNAGHMKEAKQYLLKAAAADPSYADTHYLMGLVLVNEGNLSGAKASFKKYLELAPTGKHAAEVKEMLSGF